MDAVVWFLIGLVVLILELVLPGLVLFFFGIGAWIVAILLLIDKNITLTWQMIIFLFVSVTSLIFLRKYFQNLFKGKVDFNKPGSDIDDEIMNKRVVVIERITPELTGKVEFKGTNWKAQSEDTLEKGEEAIIIGKNNLTLIVKKIK